MNIFKTQFISFLKLLKYTHLKEILEQKQKQTFVWEPELDLLLSPEEQKNPIIQRLKQQIIPAEKNAAVLEEQKQLAVKLPQFKKLELLFGQYLQNNFSGEVIYHESTSYQKKLSYAINNHEFSSFVDVFGENDSVVELYEVKASLANEYLKIKFKDHAQKEHFLFEAVSNKSQSPLCYQINPQAYDFLNQNRHYLTPQSKLGNHLYDLAFQAWLLENNPFYREKKKKYFLVLLNGQYVSSGSNTYDSQLFSVIDLTAIMSLTHKIMEKDVLELTQHLNDSNSEKDLMMEQIQHYTKIPFKNNLFTYFNSHLGFKQQSVRDLLRQNYYHALDLPIDWLTRPNNLMQRTAIETQQPYYHWEKINAMINTLQYPLYFLDFETFPSPLPRFKGEKPYSQSLFQFSVHIEKTPGLCDKKKDNYAFLASDNQTDQRKALLEKLLTIIPDDGGSIVVYYKSFEQKRLEELASLFPEYSLKIKNMIQRLFDLLDVIKGNVKSFQKLGFSKEEASQHNFYHPDLNGSYSIKHVLPLFSTMNYDHLTIKNGAEALTTYASFHQLEKDQLAEKKAALLEYCSQDTFAMFEILTKMKQLISKKTEKTQNITSTF